MTYDAALKLGLKALSTAIDEKLKADSIEVGVVRTDAKFRRLTEDEMSKVLAKSAEKPKAASKKTEKA